MPTLPVRCLYGADDLRDVIQRASARETAARVACGAVARRVLSLARLLGPQPRGGGRRRDGVRGAFPQALALVDDDPLRCLDPGASARMRDAVVAAGQEGDTLGGVFEVAVDGFPPGVGSYVQPDRRLGARTRRGAAADSPPSRASRSVWGSPPRRCRARRSTTRSSGRPKRATAARATMPAASRAASPPGCRSSCALP